MLALHAFAVSVWPFLAAMVRGVRPLSSLALTSAPLSNISLINSMTITLDLRPELEARLKTTAARAGLSPVKYLEDWIEQIPEVMPDEELATLIAESQEPPKAASTGSLSELFAQWRKEDETSDPDELARRDTELEELKANLNANRAATGEEPLFL